VDDRGIAVTEVLRFDLDDGGSVLVEVLEEPGVVRTARRGTLLQDAKLSFEKTLAGVRDAASSALGQFQSMSHRPDEVEIKFGVKLDAKAGAIIAQTGMQGHFEVKLKWQRSSSVDEATSAEEPA
jgi:hypothetical protein